jgi:hypothetical protein
MNKTKAVIMTPSGPIEPISPGLFVEREIGRVIHRPVDQAFDDQLYITCVEMGAMQDEDSLKFRQQRLPMKEIFDVDLLTNSPEHRQFREAAITHFGIQELHKFASKLKNSVPEINGDLHIQDIEDLSIEFMKECGSDGQLIWMKNSVIVVDPTDFQLHLGEVYKAHRKSTMMCGALFCSRPARVIKASYSGRVRLV